MEYKNKKLKLKSQIINLLIQFYLIINNAILITSALGILWPSIKKLKKLLI